MKILNKIGDTFSQTVDVIVEKNRQAAYINRLKAIILSEQERINKAYVVLGKEFVRNKEGKKSSGFDPDEVIEEIADGSENPAGLKKGDKVVGWIVVACGK